MAKTATTKSTKRTSKKSEALIVEHAMTAEIPQVPADEIEALLSGLNDLEVSEDTASEVIEEVPELELEAAVNAAEVVEANAELYAEQPAGDDMKLDEPAAVVEVAAPKKGKGKKAKAEGGEKKERKPRETMIGKKLSEIMSSKMGDSIGDFMVWDAAEAELAPEAMQAMVKERIEALNGLPMKPQNKFRYIMNTLQTGKPLQEYVKRAFVCLVRDGEITTGKDGNYVKEMTAPAAGKAFGMGTANSQVAQMQTLLPFLKVATKERGRLIVNPDSLIVEALKPHLGL